MGDKTNTAAPYTSFNMFHSLLVRLSRMNRPDAIRPSILGLKNGRGTFSHLIASLRYFRLVDDAGTPQDSLLQLAMSSEGDRKVRVGDLLKEYYSFLLRPSDSFDLSNASIKDLRRRFSEHDGTSETVASKSASFFVGAATYAGIPLSNKIQTGGYKLPGASDHKRNTNAGGNVSNAKQSSTTKSNPSDMNDSEKAFSDALRELADIFFDAQDLPEHQRKDLAQQAIKWANRLIGEK